MARTQIVLVAHPSADLYGSDLQLLETVTAITSAGWEAHVVLPIDGPLAGRLRERGATVVYVPFPVLRKSSMTPVGLMRLAWSILMAFPRMLRVVRSVGPQVVLVNTVTIPWWLVAGRTTRCLTVCHVHEAEDRGARVVLTALALPQLLAHRLIVNSEASGEALTRYVPRLQRRMTVVHNGFPGPQEEPDPVRVRTVGERATLVVVARLSPRKGIDVALEALAVLRAEGRPLELLICGTVFSGYEWFEELLHRRAEETDLAGSVHFRGYVSPTWPVLAQADIVLVPSRAEPFGNTAVEALLASRPLVASDVQGLREIVRDGVNGLLATPGDAHDLAHRIAILLDQPAAADALAASGRKDALERFSQAAYSASIRRLLQRP
ncbi:MAG: glycosyltransferase family 4 protein [Kineosporiaceae bacterium]|nr:glycosyltransferase family 4 protein [Aeromicrobium sp.]